MKRIVVKEVDRLKSQLFDEKTVSEYLIYVILNQGNNDVNLICHVEYGDENKKNRINELLLEYFYSDDSLNTITITDIIQEVSFEEIIKLKKKNGKRLSPTNRLLSRQ
jgi:hypothetical protein